MERWLRVGPDRREPTPAHLGDDVRYRDEVVELFVGELTRPGDVVLDPFAGFGTTLVVAERLGRRAVGVELLPERAEHIRGRSPTAEVITADARRLHEVRLPAAQLVMTSPPYMTRTDHPQNPLSGYSVLDGDYEQYLSELASVFGHLVDNVLLPSGHVVVNVANIHQDDSWTPLAWDVERVLRGKLTLERELVVIDDQMPPWISQDYCLVFRPRT